MKSTIKKIDRALKSLYQLTVEYYAEDFLIEQKPHALLGAAYNQSHAGALYLYSEKPEEQDFEIAVYLSPPIQKILKTFPSWKQGNWKTNQLSAFAIAAEEVSHFNYFLTHMSEGRKVTQLELETQGEIDKFLMVYFSNYTPGKENYRLFVDLFHKIFIKFKLSDRLNTDEKKMYLQANHDAKNWIDQIKDYLIQGNMTDLGLKILRKKYRS